MRWRDLSRILIPEITPDVGGYDNKKRHEIQCGLYHTFIGAKGRRPMLNATGKEELQGAHLC